MEEAAALAYKNYVKVGRCRLKLIETQC